MLTKMTIPGKISFLMAALTVSVLLGFPEPLSATAQARNVRPAEFIQSLADEAIAVLRDPSGSLEERERKFRAVLRDDFAMEKIGRFAAGRYWREMTDEQKNRYQSLFEEWVLKSYSIRFGGYDGETVHVLNTIEAGDSDFFVRTKIENAKGRSLKVDWRVRRIDERYKILDVVVEGVSMLVTQKAEFGSVIRERGIEGLIGLLRTQLDRLASQPG